MNSGFPQCWRNFADFFLAVFPPFIAHYFAVSNHNISRLKTIFDAADTDKTGSISCSEVLHLCGVLKSPFTDHLFEMVGEEK